MKLDKLYNLLILWCRYQELNSGPSDYKTYSQINDTYKSTTYSACHSQNQCHTAPYSGISAAVWHKFDTIDFMIAKNDCVKRLSINTQNLSLSILTLLINNKQTNHYLLRNRELLDTICAYND